MVFADGTYEGKPYLAAVTRATMAGSKTQLRRVIPLLQAARESVEGGDVNAMGKLKEAVALLGEDTDPAQLKEIQDQFPTLNEGERKNLANFVRSGLHQVKATLLKEIEAPEKGGQLVGDSLAGEWIAKTKERYEKWLSAL